MFTAALENVHTNFGYSMPDCFWIRSAAGDRRTVKRTDGWSRPI